MAKLTYLRALRSLSCLFRLFKGPFQTRGLFLFRMSGQTTQ